MRIGYTYSALGDYHSSEIDIVLESDKEVAEGDLVYVRHPKNGEPVLFQVTKVYSHKEARDYEEALIKEGNVIVDEERTTVRAKAYQWGWLDGSALRPLRHPLKPNVPVFKAEPDVIEKFTKPSSGWKILLGRDLSSGIDVELDLYYLIRQCCLICGAVGTGKTTTAISMVARAAQADPPVRFLIVDKDGEYKSLKTIFREDVKVIPWYEFFQPDDIRLEDLLAEFGWQKNWWTSKILMKAFDLLKNSGQQLVKKNLAAAVRAVRAEDIGFRRQDADFEGYKRQVLEAVKSSGTIPESTFQAVDPVEQIKRFKIVIMDLSKGSNGWAKMHVVLTQVLTRIFHHALENSDFGCVIVLEEAMYYAPQWTQFSIGDRDIRGRLLSIIKEIATNGGRNGVGLWVVTQRLATVDKTIITQCANNIVSHSLEDIDKRRLQEVVGDQFVELLGSLPQGEAIVKGTALKCRFPILVKVEPELRPTSAATPPIARFRIMEAKQRELKSVVAR